MSIFRPSIRFAGVVTGVALAFGTQAKPPMQAKEEKKSSPIPAKAPAAGETGSTSLLKWLLLQNGGADAVSVAWPELVRATTGKQVVPLDPANPADAATVAKFGAALDLVLPLLNRPDGKVRSDSLHTSAEIAARIADDLRTTLSTSGTTVANSSDVVPFEGCYPDFRCVDAASGKIYYFSVVIFPTGGRESSLSALAYGATETSKRITADGCCLLVAIEHNGKPGAGLAFLNWELIDLAKVSVRCSVGFEADENALHQPSTVVSDGRKGRD